jgi:hypothetical protein
MKLLNFQVRFEKEYTILRDYYIDNRNVKGILFVLQDAESKQVHSEFLEVTEVNDTYVWHKLKKKEVKYFAAGIEASKEGSKLIVETGIINGEKRNMVGIKKPAELSAKRYRYLLKQD